MKLFIIDLPSVNEGHSKAYILAETFSEMEKKAEAKFTYRGGDHALITTVKVLTEGYNSNSGRDEGGNDGSESNYFIN